MKRTLITLTIAAALSGGASFAAVPAWGTGTAAQTPSVIITSPWSPEQAKSELLKITGPGSAAVVQGVSVYGGRMYTAAFADGWGTTQIYREIGDGWRKIDELAHPPSASSGSGAPKVTGGTIEGLQAPVFIVKANFSMNETGNAIAISSGAKGWGALVGKGERLESSGDGLAELNDPGVEYDINFVDGALQTKSMWGPGYEDVPYWEMKKDPIVRTWVGDGGALQMTAEFGGPFD